MGLARFSVYTLQVKLTIHVRYSNVRIHFLEMQLPSDSHEAVSMVRQTHEILSQYLCSHIDAEGHTVLPLKDEDIIDGKKYVDVVGENGATFYLRRKFQPDKIPNWAAYNEGIMEAFYHKKGIKLGGTINSVKCGEEWIADRS